MNISNSIRINIALRLLLEGREGMKNHNLGDCYLAYKLIKKGCAYDKRHRANRLWFNRPDAIIFTNSLPCFDLMIITI